MGKEVLRILNSINGLEDIGKMEKAMALLGVNAFCLYIEDKGRIINCLNRLNGLNRLNHLYTLPLCLDGETYGVIDIYNSIDSYQAIEELKEDIAHTLKRVTEFENTKELALLDPLTCLYNRRYLLLRFPEEMNRVKRSGDPLSIAMLDIDHFKEFNDLQGHLEGDRVLKKMSMLFSEVMRRGDFAIRFGGDEFIVVLPMTDRLGVVDVIERLRTAFKRRFNGLSMTAAALTLSSEREIGHILVELDNLLYAGKGAGRDIALAKEL